MAVERERLMLWAFDILCKDEWLYKYLVATGVKNPYSTSELLSGYRYALDRMNYVNEPFMFKDKVKKRINKQESLKRRRNKWWRVKELNQRKENAVLRVITN